MSDEILVKVEGVSKKFCRSLKKSLWYGVCDMASELSPFARMVKSPLRLEQGEGQGEVSNFQPLVGPLA